MNKKLVQNDNMSDIANSLSNTYDTNMNPEEQRVLAALDFVYEAADTPDARVEDGLWPMEHEKESLLSAFYDHLSVVLKLGPIEHKAAIDMLSRLLGTDTRLPDIAPGTPIVAGGAGSLMLPSEEDILFFGGGERIKGTYQAFSVGEYYDAENLEDFDAERDYRPFGIYMFLTEPVLVSADGEEEAYDSQIAILPLNHPQLQLFRVIPHNFSS